MKNIIKYIIMSGLLVAATGSLKAQAPIRMQLNSPERKKLPSSQPMPDKMILMRKIEQMRKAVREQEEQARRHDAERSQAAPVQTTGNKKTS